MQTPRQGSEPHPVKRTEKKYKDFPVSRLHTAGRILCSKSKLVFFKRCQYPKIALHPSGIVIADVVLNHLDEFLLTGKTTVIITLSFQDAPEPFHGAVVNAVRDTGHTLRHTSLQKFMVKGSVSILEPSVAMEQWMSIRVGLNSLVKGFVDERIVIAITDHIGHDTPVAEVKDGTKIDLVYRNSLIPLELSHISQPFLVGLFCMELAVQKVLRNILGVLGLPSASTVSVLDG